MSSKIRKLVALSLFLAAFCPLLAAVPSEPLKSASLNVVDRLTMQPYNSTLSDISTVTAAAALCAPGLLALPALKEGDTGTVVSLGFQYALVMGGSWATKEVLKTSVARARPYMYYENPPAEKLEEGEWNRSFPSGHTTASFAAAAFTVYTCNDLFPESSLRWAVGALSYGTAATIAALRVASGSHFVTDVAAGAAIGTLWGFGVPMINKWLAANYNQGWPSRGTSGTWLTITPAGAVYMAKW